MGADEPHDINTQLIAPADSNVVLLFGATGDLARRKLLPGLFHLFKAGLLPRARVLGVSLDVLDDEQFRAFACGQPHPGVHDHVLAQPHRGRTGSFEGQHDPRITRHVAYLELAAVQMTADQLVTVEADPDHRHLG